jgi:hypothetical protein
MRAAVMSGVWAAAGLAPSAVPAITTAVFFTNLLRFMAKL